MVWGPNVEHASLLYKLNLATTGLSILGSLFMAISCYRSLPSKSAALKFIFALAISDFFYTVSNVLSAFEDDTNGILCHTEAFIRQLFYQLTIYLSAAMSILCYRTVAHGRKFNQHRFFKLSVASGLIIGTTLNFLPFFVKEAKYLNGDVFCWIASSTKDSAFAIIIDLFYGAIPVILGCTVSVVSYIGAIIKIRQLPREFLENMEISIFKLLWYPLVLFVIFTPSIIHGFAIQYFKAQSGIALYATYLALTHSTGFINAIVYGFQRKLYNIGARKRDSSKFEPLEDENENEGKSSNSNSVNASLIRARIDTFC